MPVPENLCSYIFVPFQKWYNFCVLSELYSNNTVLHLGGGLA